MSFWSSLQSHCSFCLVNHNLHLVACNLSLWSSLWPSRSSHLVGYNFCLVGCSLHPFGLDLHGLFFSHDLIVLLITYTPQQYPIPLFLLLLVNCLFKVVVNVLQHVILFDVEPLPIVSPSFELLLFSKGSPPYSQMGELTFCLENYGEIFACYCATTPAN